MPNANRFQSVPIVPAEFYLVQTGRLNKYCFPEVFALKICLCCFFHLSACFLQYALPLYLSCVSWSFQTVISPAGNDMNLTNPMKTLSVCTSVIVSVISLNPITFHLLLTASGRLNSLKTTGTAIAVFRHLQRLLPLFPDGPKMHADSPNCWLLDWFRLQHWTYYRGPYRGKKPNLVQLLKSEFSLWLVPKPWYILNGNSQLQPAFETKVIWLSVRYSLPAPPHPPFDAGVLSSSSCVQN